jgi:hypothetical protein
VPEKEEKITLLANLTVKIIIILKGRKIGIFV